MKIIELQDSFAVELAASVGAEFDSIKVHYENMTVEGHCHQIFNSFYFTSGSRIQFNLSLEALDLLSELNKNQPESQAERWTWLKFEMDNSGKYAFDYEYGIPPNLANRLKYSAS